MSKSHDEWEERATLYLLGMVVIALIAALSSGCSYLMSAEERLFDEGRDWAEKVCNMTPTDRAALRARLDDGLDPYVLRLEGCPEE